MASVLVPKGYDPEEYRDAQERMWTVSARRDLLLTLSKEIDRQLEGVLKEGRELLEKFPTLSLRALR